MTAVQARLIHLNNMTIIEITLILSRTMLITQIVFLLLAVIIMVSPLLQIAGIFDFLFENLLLDFLLAMLHLQALTIIMNNVYPYI